MHNASLHELFTNKYIKHVEKHDGKTYEFYAFNGYKPIIRELVNTECHLPGTRGCFKHMFVEKGKAKVVCVIRNNDEIETVCYMIENSWMIGNAIPQTVNDMGNLGFFTRPKYRGNGNSHKICKFMEKNLIKYFPQTKNRNLYIQEHVTEKLGKNFEYFNVEKLEYGEHGWEWFLDDILSSKHPYAIDYDKEYSKLYSSLYN